MVSLLENYNSVKTKIRDIRNISNSKQPVQLVAVSKTFGTDVIRELYSYGQSDFAENYAQEFYMKAVQLRDLDIKWHFIGSIQGNKIRYIAEHASWIHSLENIDHAIKLNKYRTESQDKINVLIEINISEEKNKHGLINFNEIVKLGNEINGQKNLKLRGVMGMASDSQNQEVIHKQFHKLKNIFEKIKAKGFDIDTLSMGMSNDFDLAILSGSNMVRIGKRLFGERNYAKRSP